MNVIRAVEPASMMPTTPGVTTRFHARTMDVTRLEVVCMPKGTVTTATHARTIPVSRPAAYAFTKPLYAPTGTHVMGPRAVTHKAGNVPLAFRKIAMMGTPAMAPKAAPRHLGFVRRGFPSIAMMVWAATAWKAVIRRRALV